MSPRPPMMPPFAAASSSSSLTSKRQPLDKGLASLSMRASTATEEPRSQQRCGDPEKVA